MYYFIKLNHSYLGGTLVQYGRQPAHCQVLLHKLRPYYTVLFHSSFGFFLSFFFPILHFALSENASRLRLVLAFWNV